MLRRLKPQVTANDLMKGNFGLERESLRIDLKGHLAMTPHPQSLGDKLKNPYITTDFSEAQIELVTPPKETVDEAFDFLTALYNLSAGELKDERFWPQSLPCVISKGQEVPIAKFSDTDRGRELSEYREYLIDKYGGKTQLISGIHYNFSFSDNLLRTLFTACGESDFKAFRNQVYLKQVRNFLRLRWFVNFFLGATPSVDESFTVEIPERVSQVLGEEYLKPKFVSIRNTALGYRNKKELHPSYDSVEAFVDSLDGFIKEGTIKNAMEFYCPIRLRSKAKTHHQIMQSLLDNGVQYVEIRSIDLNPFELAGVSLEDLKFVHLFMLYLLDLEEDFEADWQEEADLNETRVSVLGRDTSETLLKDGEEVSILDWAKEIFKNMSAINEAYGLGLEGVLANKLDELEGRKPTLSARLAALVSEKGYENAYMELAEKHYQEGTVAPYRLPGFTDMEMSTQLLISEAIKQGIRIDILDRDDNFLKLEKDGFVQLVKQATKTALDNYITVLAMENKEVTKRILETQGLPVPKGINFTDQQDAIMAYSEFSGKSVVIKPKSTNYGWGITIFTPLKDPAEFETALKHAFSYDSSVIVEEFQPGQEYRFLVVEQELVAVLKRVPANIIGDGIHTIQELVDEKNKDVLRGTHHQKPLEKIEIDDPTLLFLHAQNLTPGSIPRKGEQIFLRKNSNISTGGDSVDVTDETPEYFKQLAIDAVQKFGARICGLDMIIEDITDPTSTLSIIELNFNPAIHMHAYPYAGTPRNAIPFVLKALGFE
ncbi:MAG: bifunctional glutamate--cysteine ligase GshA/glutathione synthetase GshB [Turicibacter sp.]|nr:bifunctional glutamate--cysteine ligase GshA/glutathione synthetase GshB [Turicibacter sp.]